MSNLPLRRTKDGIARMATAPKAARACRPFANSFLPDEVEQIGFVPPMRGCYKVSSLTGWKRHWPCPLQALFHTSNMGALYKNRHQAVWTDLLISEGSSPTNRTRASSLP